MPHCKHKMYCVFLFVFCFKGGGWRLVANQTGEGFWRGFFCFSEFMFVRYREEMKG